MSEIINYKPMNVCCKNILIKIDNNKISNIQFIGGCQGNLLGIGNLVINMDIQDVITKLNGIPCGSKNTSCPDQLSKCLQDYINKNGGKNENN